MPVHDREGMELRQKPVRELLAELVRLADTSRSARASSALPIDTVRSDERTILAELRRRRAAE